MTNNKMNGPTTLDSDGYHIEVYKDMYNCLR